MEPLELRFAGLCITEAVGANSVPIGHAEGGFFVAHQVISDDHFP